ncbi:Csu type fimbrial protein [Tsuneonella amylolytica]|uniref:Csu type fimbrial protein n=1 Tax=Tsuneonella amylolytica TaxID=2338327 RepID=UPI000EA9F487|nr:spore coat U domain-containing protein [Tsuneonella amylolytica]
MRKIAIIAAAATAAVASPALAAGQTASGTVDVLLQVTNSCSVKAEALAFPAISDFTAATNGSSPTLVNCTLNAPYTVFVDYGQNAGSTTQRKLKFVDASSATHLINYNVYTTTARTTEWTPTTGVSGVGTGADQPMTLWGTVPAQASKPAGGYKDQVVVTLNY